MGNQLKKERELLAHYERQYAEERRLYQHNGLSAHHESMHTYRRYITHQKELIKELETQND